MSYYSSTIMNDSPTAYYRLDELSGTVAADSTSNAFNGTYNATGVTLGVVGALSADPDTAVAFDGIAGKMTMASGVTLATGPFSIEFWFKAPTISSAYNKTLIANDNPATSHNGINIGLSSTGALTLTMGNGTIAGTSTCNYPFASNTWYHVVVSLASSMTSIYINGVLKESDNIYAFFSMAAGGFSLTVAHDPNATDFFPGSVDEVAIYNNTALSPSRVAAHYLAALITLTSGGIGSGSIIDLHTQKIQVCRVFDPSGNFLGVWPDAPHISGLKDTINCAQSQVKLVLPRKIDDYTATGQMSGASTIAMGNQVQIYIYGPGLPTTGLLKFNGFIDIIEPAVTESQQQSVTVTLTPYSAVFGDHGYGGNLQFTNVDPVALFKYWFNTTDPITGVPYTSPMVWAAGNPTSSNVGTVNYLVQNQDLKSLSDMILLMLGNNWYWRPNPDNTVTFGKVATTAQHTFLLGQHMASMSYSIDNTQRKNVIYFVGKTGISAVAKGPSAKPPNQGGIGERILFHQDSRITDTSSAQIVANGMLTIYDNPLIRAKMRLVDYRGDSSGLGYDIENLKVGDSATVLNARGHILPSLWGSFIWGKDKYAQAGAGQIFNAIIPIVALTYGWSYTDVELGVLAPSQDRALFQVRKKIGDYTVGT